MSFRRKVCLVALPALIAVASGTVPGAAHDGAKGVVKERMDAMKDMSRASKTLSEMFKGERKYDPILATRLATEIATDTDKLQGMFPPGSTEAPSRTLPSAWTDRKGFVDAFAALKSEALKLAQTAQGGSQREAMVQFFRMSRSCSSCHRSYRARD